MRVICNMYHHKCHQTEGRAYHGTMLVPHDDTDDTGYVGRVFFDVTTSDSMVLFSFVKTNSPEMICT